jgi:guanylate kinase
MSEGKCIILSAPSGAGKTTLVKHLLAEDLKLSFSISASTREPRGKEEHGVDYYFLSPEEFKRKVEEGHFVEWEEVYTDHCYGTLKSEVDRIWADEKHLIFDVDVVGGLNLKKYFGDKALAIFVMPPDMPSLESRLRARGTDSEEKILQRLAKAKQELITADQFDHIILNDDLDKAKKEVKKIVTTFLAQ